MIVTPHPEIEPAGVSSLLWEAEEATAPALREKILEVVADPQSAADRARKAAEFIRSEMTWADQFGAVWKMLA